jgi:predicted site-specific integrase-resolvase
MQQEQRFHKIGAASRILGVSKVVLHNWAHDSSIRTIRTPGNQILFDLSSIEGYKVEQAKPIRSRVLYSRVSSAKQKNDLERQKQYLSDNLPDEYTGPRIDISDIGSGINFKRPGLLRLLGLVKAGSVQDVIVSSKDRLARFGFELIEWICTQHDTKLIILDSKDGAPEEELGKDLMAIVQVYCCRWNGRRRYSSQTSSSQAENSEAETVPESSSEAEAGTVGGVQ